MFNDGQKKKITIITALTAVFLIAVLLKFNFENYLSLQNLRKIIISNSNKETYHIISKFDLMPAAASRVIPSIVHISLDRKSPYKLKHKKFGINIYKPLIKNYRSLGSGVIVSPDGYIVTNNHVVENLSGRIKVELPGNASYPAKIIGRDPKTDIAVIKIKAKNLPCIDFGDSANVRIGDVVLAVGNPFGIGESVTMGIISATGRSNIGIIDYEDFIQTDAAINPGNSGGALVNVKGELVGINTAILTKSGGYEGISFAIPSNMAYRVYTEIIKKGKVERGWIGIAVQNTCQASSNSLWYESRSGLAVVDVIAGSPANIAGIEKNDILISANGISLRDKNHLRNLILTSGINQNINFKLLRKNEFLEIPVNISKLPDDINIFQVNQ